MEEEQEEQEEQESVGTGQAMRGGDGERLTDRMWSTVVVWRFVSICGTIGITLIPFGNWAAVPHSPVYVVSSTESSTFAPTSLGSVKKLYTSSVTFHRCGNILVEGWLPSTTVKICGVVGEPSECRVRAE